MIGRKSNEMNNNLNFISIQRADHSWFRLKHHVQRSIGRGIVNTILSTNFIVFALNHIIKQRMEKK